MNWKVYWIILLNPLFLALYGYGLSIVYAFCRYGGVERRLPLIAGILGAGVLWLVLWTVFYFVLKKRSGKHIQAWKPHWVLIAEVGILVLLTGYFGQKIYTAAQPYNGKLGSYLSDLKSKREISLDETQRDFLGNGLDGILAALTVDCALNAEWELYTANTLVLTIDEAGIIQSLDAFLYAFDEEENFHSWLIGFDAAQSETMTVYLDGTANTEYMEQEQLSPLFSMIDALLSSELPASIGISQPDPEVPESQILYELRYSGYAEVNDQAYSSGNWYTVVEKTNSETADSLTPYTAPVYGATEDGFLLTIHSGGSKLATIITGAGSMETASSIQEREELENEIASAESQGGTLVNNDNGMTFYLDENTSMSLIVTDAAAGSRAYAFQNGSVYNEDPFHGHSGVAESIYFLNEYTGFILLSNASQDHSMMYYTQDGGETFTPVILPISDGEADIAGNELGYTSEDMDYINTPYGEAGILYTVVSYDYSGTHYLSMLFQSEDGGQSWRYVSFENNL